MNDQDFAVAIGIAHYPRLNRLQGPVQDAQRMRSWLIGPAGVPDANVELIVSDEQAADHPVLYEIDEAFDRIFKRAESGARRLYVYFAGHGCSKAIDHLALLMGNADLARLNRSINVTEYRNCLATMLFPEQVYLFDCCRNYDDRVSGRGPEWATDPGSDPIPGLTQVVLYAAGFTEYANERHLLYSIRRGLFTEALLEGLNGGAATRDDVSNTWVVRSDRLVAFVYDRLDELTRAEQVKQNFWSEPRGAPRPIVLSSGVEPWRRNVSVTFPTCTDRITLLDEHVQPIESRQVLGGQDTITFELPPGQYVVKAEPNGSAKVINLVVQPLRVDLEG